ncbi:MAG: ribose transport system permease protein [Verrucomicrobiales bacterium]|jgi:ribose transport system permease protein
MKRILGILILLAVVYVATWIMADWNYWFGDQRKAVFMTGYNQENLLRRTALYGILGVGVAFVIITSGIDLSLGSMVCLIGVGVPWMIVGHGIPIILALLFVLLICLHIGFWHGMFASGLKFERKPATKISIGYLLVAGLGIPGLLMMGGASGRTIGFAIGAIVVGVCLIWYLLQAGVRLQPFIVTLCGLLIFRGVTRGFTNDQTAGFGHKEFDGFRMFATWELPVLPDFGLPAPLLIFAFVAVLAGIFLNRTIYGRYLFALGNNEPAARFSGINTSFMTVLAYVICSVLAGLAGLLFSLDNNGGQPVDFGNFYELFGIAAAVLGGCSLRGGQGTILGVVIGTALIQLLRNMINLVFPKFQNMEFAIIGVVILVGVIADEIARQTVARKRLAQRAT